jgi:hypothetical protein
VVTIDVTNGLARESESPALAAAHRSITEPAIQRLYRNYVLAVVEMLIPTIRPRRGNHPFSGSFTSRLRRRVKMTNDGHDVRRTRTATAPHFT